MVGAEWQTLVGEEAVGEELAGFRKGEVEELLTHQAVGEGEEVYLPQGVVEGVVLPRLQVAVEEVAWMNLVEEGGGPRHHQGPLTWRAVGEGGCLSGQLMSLWVMRLNLF